MSKRYRLTQEALSMLGYDGPAESVDILFTWNEDGTAVLEGWIPAAIVERMIKLRLLDRGDITDSAAVHEALIKLLSCQAPTCNNLRECVAIDLHKG